jgi:hypothetical protein
MNSCIGMVAVPNTGSPAVCGMKALVAGSVQAHSGSGASALEGNYKKR